MNRRMRIAALLVASLSVAGCRAPYEARIDEQTTSDTVNMAIPDPSGPAKAARDAAAKANGASQDDQEAIEALTSP
jgi:outer membrane murein-binding lipoprotein Lpp